MWRGGRDVPWALASPGGDARAFVEYFWSEKRMERGCITATLLLVEEGFQACRNSLPIEFWGGDVYLADVAFSRTHVQALVSNTRCEKGKNALRSQEIPACIYRRWRHVEFNAFVSQEQRDGLRQASIENTWEEKNGRKK